MNVAFAGNGCATSLVNTLIGFSKWSENSGDRKAVKVASPSNPPLPIKATFGFGKPEELEERDESEEVDEDILTDKGSMEIPSKRNLENGLAKDARSKAMEGDDYLPRVRYRDLVIVVSREAWAWDQEQRKLSSTRVYVKIYMVESEQTKVTCAKMSILGYASHRPCKVAKFDDRKRCSFFGSYRETNNACRWYSKEGLGIRKQNGTNVIQIGEFNLKGDWLTGSKRRCIRWYDIFVWSGDIIRSDGWPLC